MVNAADKKVLITCVPQTKQNKMPSEWTKRKDEEKKDESMFVTSLIFHTLQIGVYCIGRGRVQDEWV